MSRATITEPYSIPFVAKGQFRINLNTYGNVEIRLQHPPKTDTVFYLHDQNGKVHGKINIPRGCAKETISTRIGNKSGLTGIVNMNVSGDATAVASMRLL